MKLLITIIFLVSSMSVFSHYHFECYQIVGSRLADQKFLLVPNADNLQSGASFFWEHDQSYGNNFNFVKSSRNIAKSKIKLESDTGEIIKIDASGNLRKMVLKDQKYDQTEYQCFIESSI